MGVTQEYPLTDVPVTEEQSQLVDDEELEHGQILYSASFGEEENWKRYMLYSTVIFIAFLPLFVLCTYGVGIILICYLPILRYRCLKDIQSRKLYVTSESVVYKARPPAFCPCFGVNSIEKHVLLHLVTDVVVKQGWLENCFGISTVQIENAGQGGNQVGADLALQGLVDPKELKRVLLMAASAKRNGRRIGKEDIKQFLSASGFGDSSNDSIGPGAFSRDVDITNNKLDDLNNTLQRIEKLMQTQLEFQQQLHAPPKQLLIQQDQLNEL